MEKEFDLKKFGYIYLYDEFEGKYSKIIRKFLVDTVSNFAKETMIYLRRKDSDIYPFIYNEIVLNSVLLPALKMSSDSSIVLMEFPIDRIKNNESKSDNNLGTGRVDFYIIHKEINILLELKFGWISYNSLLLGNDIRKNLVEKIKSASNQIKDIDWDDPLKIAMLVAPIYVMKTVEDEGKFKKELENLNWDKLDKVYNEYFENVSVQIKKVLGKNSQPFLISWDIPKFEEYYWTWEKDNGKIGCEAYPTIFFIGTIVK